MMYGSILYNFWAGLFGFTFYFFTNLTDKSVPLHILLSSLLVAVISFLLMFVFRYLIAYILHTPEDILIESIPGEENGQQDIQSKADSSKEYSDESADNIANVVRTMMNEDQGVTNNS